MKWTFTFPPCGGTVSAIPSKSMAHRLLICAALADRPTKIRCPGSSEDIDATARCLTALGATVKRTTAGYTVTPVCRPMGTASLDCGESGSTLRFLLPVAAALGTGADFIRHGRLAQRPLSPLYEELLRHGARLPENPETEPLPLRGNITAGEYEIAANVSSQFISGLLLAMPRMNGESVLNLTGRIESSDYIRITLAAMRVFGASVSVSDDGRRYVVRGGGYTSPGMAEVEGDWSGSAMWLAAGALGAHPVTVTGLNTDSAQGDRAILDVLRAFGAKVQVQSSGITVFPSALSGIELDAAQIPDLVPVIAPLAAAASGETIISGIARLRLKESDRAAAIREMLTSLGISVTEEPDRLLIRGGSIQGGTVSAFRDHRMVMCAFLLSLISRSALSVTGAQAIAKSYPGFLQDLTAMGGKCTESEDA